MVGLAYWFVAYGAELLKASVDASLIFALIFFGYQLFFLRWNHGVSFGKSLRSIYVVSANATPVTPRQAGVRALVLTLPFALLALKDVVSALLGSLPDARYLATLPSILWCLAELYFAESDPLARSLTDRIARTLVVKTPPPQPHRAPAVPMYSATDAEFAAGPRLPQGAQDDRRTS